MDESRKPEPTDHLTNHGMAELIVDALVTANLISEDEFQRAIVIVAEEIDARKALGDF